MTVTQTTDDGYPAVVPYPPELVEEYRSEGLLGTLTISSELHRTALAFPERPAVRTSDLELSYAELDRQTDRIALGLRELGLTSGETVLLQLTNSAWAVLAWYGVLKAGLIPVATLAQHRRHEIGEIAGQCEPAAHLVQADFAAHDLIALGREISALVPSLRHLITVGDTPDAVSLPALEDMLSAGSDDDAENRASVGAIQSLISPDELAVLQLSGGTTSVPKLIPRLHAEYWYNARAYADSIDLIATSCVAHAMPVVHNAGIVCGVHAAHAVGACFATSGPRPEEMLALLTHTRPSHMLVTRPLADTILQDPRLLDAFASVNVIIWASGKLPANVVGSFETPTRKIIQMFGMGEGLCLVTPVSASKEIRHGTVGTFICPRDEIRIYEPGTEAPVRPGEMGELCVRGPYTIRGYYRSPERNAAAFTADGFYRTGDIVVEVKVDAPGRYFALEDRVKDLINRGGEKINAQEVEQLLQRHPAIQQAALVAMPDDRLGERACAFIVLKPEEPAPDLQRLTAFFNDLGVAKYKWPERVEVVEKLPLTNVLKVNKALLRTQIAAKLAGEQ